MPLSFTSRPPAAAAVSTVNRRWDILPLYVKAFTYLFLLTGLLAPPLLILHAYGLPVPLSIYGIEVQGLLFHSGGLLVLALYFLKGVAAFGLYNEETWGLDVALFDAVAGVAICLAGMSGLDLFPTVDTLWFRLELFLLLPYALHLYRNRAAWKLTDGLRQHFLSW